MLKPKDSEKVLLKYFQRKCILTIDELFRIIDTQSRMSVFRRLKPLGYLTSFSDAGRYYTLLNIPKFDIHGLWFYQDVGFSRSGTLKSTIVDLINSSESGFTPSEALNLLKIRTPNSLHNTLCNLVKGRYLNRHRLEGLSLYTSINPDKIRSQIAARRKQIKTHVTVLTTPLSIETTISILVETLKTGKVLPSASKVTARLVAQGVSVTADQVAQVFSQYGLTSKKKMAEQP